MAIPSIPDPSPTMDSHQETLKAVKQAVETLAGQRGASPAATKADITSLNNQINSILIRLKAAGIP